MPQAVQIEIQAEQQSLAHLHRQASPRGARRELAFDRGEYALDQSASPVESRRKRPAHLRTDTTYSPGFLSTLGGDHALCPELLTDVSMIPFAVELCIGQDQSDGSLLRGGFDHRGQIGAVVPRTAARGLRQQELLIQIRYHHPLQPMPPRQRLLPVMVQATHKNVLTAPCAKPVASTPTRARRRPFRRVPRNRRTVSPTA